ncbi:hypothetical protein F5Y10DRAFT_150614 [Nemania abortiva]|nr:hypothetical protein F5Y10DRAFT_150614 [Nemania abortiva]
MTEMLQENSPSLAELYCGCLDFFAKIAETLSKPGCDVLCLVQILEQYAKLRDWGHQNRANIPAGDYGSLDEILRHDDNLKSRVCDVLERLKTLLQQVTHVVSGKFDPEELTQQITDGTWTLPNISLLLQRTGAIDKFIRSDDAFGLFDENHVLEKVRQWRGLDKSLYLDKTSLQRVIFPDENLARASCPVNYQGVEDIQWFCQRLARANTTRREQLQNWKTHPDGPEQIVTSTSSVGNVRNITLPEVQREESQSQVYALELLDAPTLHAPERPVSVLSKQDFHTGAVSDVYESETNIGPQTVYTPTVAGQDRAHSLPKPPRAKDRETYSSCPYCGEMLESQGMGKQLWE